jgi:hypothetical protein
MSSHALNRLAKYGDRREWTLNGLLPGMQVETAMIVGNKGSGNHPVEYGERP